MATSYTTLISPEISMENNEKRNRLILTRKCDECGELYEINGEFRTICFSCKRKKTDYSVYSQTYNASMKKGFTHDQISRHIEGIIRRSNVISIDREFIRQEKTDLLLYYQFKCPKCHEKLSDKNYLWEITDYVCHIYYQCQCGQITDFWE